MNGYISCCIYPFTEFSMRKVRLSGLPIAPILGAALFALLSFIIQSCIVGIGGGTEGEGHKDTTQAPIELTGRMIDVDGLIVPGATVSLQSIAPDGTVKKASASSAFSAEVQTGADGRFRFKDLPQGQYQLEGRKEVQGNQLAVYVPSISWENKAADIGDQILQKTGSIRALVLADSLPFAGAECYIPGTRFIAITDDNGICILSDIPVGVYTLRFRSAQNLVTTVDSIRVLPGETTDLAPSNPIHLSANPELSPPSPKNLSVKFDSVLGVAHLSWGTVSVSDLDGYFVYRRSRGVVFPVALNSTPLHTTQFRDTLFNNLGGWDSAAQFTYSLKSIDKDGNLSTEFSASQSIQASSPLWLERLWPPPAMALSLDSLILSWTLNGPAKNLAKVSIRIGVNADPDLHSEACSGIGLSECDIAALKLDSVFYWSLNAEWLGRRLITQSQINRIKKPQTPIDTTTQDPTFSVEYNFDSNSTDTIYPGVQGQPIARAYGGATSIAGIVGNGIRLDGKTGYLSIADGSFFTNQTRFMIEGWFRLPRNPLDWRRLIGLWGPSGRGDDSWQLVLTPTGKLAFDISEGLAGSLDVHLESRIPVPSGAWTYVAAVYRGDSSFVYINGEEVGKTASMKFVSQTIQGRILIGASDVGEVINHLEVDIDAIRLTNRILSHAQIAERYEALKP